MPNPYTQKAKKAQKTQKGRGNVLAFNPDNEVVVDPAVVTREGVTVCPFGNGLVCNAPGCMVCNEGPRCCNAGDTCYVDADDVTNWCTAFQGVGSGDGRLPPDMVARAPKAHDMSGSFWER